MWTFTCRSTFLYVVSDSSENIEWGEDFIQMILSGSYKEMSSILADQ